MEEFIKTGTCSRLEELEETKQVKLVDKTPKTTKKKLKNRSSNVAWVFSVKQALITATTRKATICLRTERATKGVYTRTSLYIKKTSSLG